LIELLVVVGIIALIISMLLPALSRARAAAARTSCLSNQRQLALALQMYENRFRGFPPHYIHTGNPGASHRLYDASVPGSNGATGYMGSYQGWLMLGMLYGTGIIVKTPDPKGAAPFMFFCPVQYNSLLKYPEGWYSDIKRGGYSYRISVDLINEPNKWFPFIQNNYDKDEYKQAYKGRFRKPWALTSDIVCADGGVASTDMLVWSHDRPPFVQVGFSDGHAECVRIPDSVYKLSVQTLSSPLANSDRMCLGIFQAADTKDFKKLESWLKTLP
jgi:hypothetical protein